MFRGNNGTNHNGASRNDNRVVRSGGHDDGKNKPRQKKSLIAIALCGLTVLLAMILLSEEMHSLLGFGNPSSYSIGEDGNAVIDKFNFNSLDKGESASDDKFNGNSLDKGASASDEEEGDSLDKGASASDEEQGVDTDSTSKDEEVRTSKDEEVRPFTKFTDNCYLVDEQNQRRRLQDEPDHDHRFLKPVKTDKLDLGRCHYHYPTRVAPQDGGFLQEIDYFHFRDNKSHDEREACLLYCIDQLRKKERKDPALLIQATVMGLTQVVKKLKTKYGLDPLHSPSLGPDHDDKPGFNAVQEAIKGGYAGIVKILTDGNNDLVIDSLGRTVADYVLMNGSPIRPKAAAEILGLRVNVEAKKKGKEKIQHPSYESGWNVDSQLDYDPDVCDIDVIHGDMNRETFYNEYYMTGRPFVLRGLTPKTEISAFAKPRWETTSRFHSDVKVRVGPTAYPNLTGQKRCSENMSIAEIEKAKECKEMPGVPMVHARHPTDVDLKELYPMYRGNLYDPSGGWRKLAEWFSPKPREHHLGWQVFFGGDASGATLHWHNAAFNALYVGIKTWKLTPPLYRGFTGMPAHKAAKKVDDAVALQCTQHPGDIMYIPNYWGHLTLNHGFAIGAAVIMNDSFQRYADAKRKVFFVHINKTGGTSMIRMLQKSCDSEYVAGRWGGGHRSFHATALSFIDHFGRGEWDNARTFAVVRHPLARQVSNFFFLLDRCSKKGGGSAVCEDRLIPTDLDPSSMSDEEKIEAFHTYMIKLYENYPPGSKGHHLFGSKNDGNEEYESFNATQTSWLVDENDEIVVRNIFHLETLDDDMEKLTDAIPCLKNVDTATSRKTKEVEMLHINSTPKYPNYKLFGKNKRVNEIMKEVFAVDYKNFGYEFE